MASVNGSALSCPFPQIAKMATIIPYAAATIPASTNAATARCVVAATRPLGWISDRTSAGDMLCVTTGPNARYCCESAAGAARRDVVRGALGALGVCGAIGTIRNPSRKSAACFAGRTPGSAGEAGSGTASTVRRSGRAASRAIRRPHRPQRWSCEMLCDPQYRQVFEKAKLTLLNEILFDRITARAGDLPVATHRTAC